MAYLAPLVLKQEPKLKRQVCCALAQIAKHSVDMAEVVVEAEVFPKILTCLKFPDELVRKHAATVVREVSLPLTLSGLHAYFTMLGFYWCPYHVPVMCLPAVVGRKVLASSVVWHELD